MDDKEKIEQLKKSFQNIQVPSEVDLMIKKGIQRGKAQKRAKWIQSITAAAACITIAAASIFLITQYEQTANIHSKITVAKVLPVVGSESQLKILLKDFQGGDGRLTLKEAAQKSESVNDFSSTNVQVQGVDEADTVKTDGEYIYKVNGKSVIITKAYPVQQMKEISKIKDTNLWIQEIFIKNQYLVMLGQANQTVCRVYDITNKEAPKLVREIKIDGMYHTSRMIGSQLYFIANKSIRWGWKGEEKNQKIDDRAVRPIYSDSISGGKEIAVGYDKIQYCPEAIAPNYITIGSFNIDKQKEKVNITSILGSADNVYVSEKNIYIAGMKESGPIRILTDDKKASRMMSTIYKFTLNQGSVKFEGDGKVPGITLNQFSMDEQNGYLRIGTTEYSYGTQEQMKNHLYILDKSMKITGKIENIAPGERIYSTRFIGDKGYIVTFKNTDPLFVIDLKNPSDPKILGELKIPGFSQYLHPYDKNHLIGFGQDTEESNGTVKIKGMKIALFDVTDVNHPKQLFEEKIGGAAAYASSELFYNHKALLFSKQKNIMAFPVTITNPNRYRPSFIGTYVYSIDLKKGFILQGKITHYDIAELTLKKNNKNWRNIYYNFGRIERTIYIEDILYTVSPFGVKANYLNNIKELQKLTFKELPDHITQ